MKTISYNITILLLVFCSSNKAISQSSNWGINDTLFTGAIVYEGDTIEAKVLKLVSSYNSSLQLALPHDSEITRYNFSSIYIPTLRGLRPIQSNSSNNDSFIFASGVFFNK